MKLVTFKVYNMDYEHYEYSVFFDFECDWVDNTKLVEEIYGEVLEGSDDKYIWLKDDYRGFQVVSIQDIAKEELDVLKKFGVADVYQVGEKEDE